MVVHVFEKQNLSLNPSNIFIIFHYSMAAVLRCAGRVRAPPTSPLHHNIVSFSSLQIHKIALLLVLRSNGNTQLEILKLFLFERHKEWGFSSCAWSEKVERLFVIQ